MPHVGRDQSEIGNLSRPRLCKHLPHIRWNREALEQRGWGTRESFSMSLLGPSIEPNLLTRGNFGLIALTVLGVLAIVLAFMLPNSITL
jgi:hypothetical protein